MDKTIPNSNPDYETSIVYEDKGIWVSSNTELRRTENGTEIYPEMQINEITFFEPGENPNLVMVQLTEAKHVLEELIACLKIWEGFGIYEYEYGW